MRDRIVVCFRFPDLGAAPSVHFGRARELLEQAIARGAEPIATGIELYAFELMPDELEDSIELAVAVARRGASGGVLAIGVSEGVLEQSDVLRDKLTLSWGPPLARAALLACTAEPGEVLIDSELGAARREELATKGTRSAAHAGLRVQGLVLDKEHPWKIAPVASAALEEAIEIVPDSEGDIDLLSSVPPRTGPASLAIAALRAGDADTVTRMAEKVRLDEGRAGLADRLHAMAHLARGETTDAIRRLELAAGAARRDGSRDRCRSALALAVALAAGGRQEEALFEALDALARARESNDPRGEHATLRFLSHLSGIAGKSEIAERWTELAEEVQRAGASEQRGI